MIKNEPEILLSDAFPLWNENQALFDLIGTMPWGSEMSSAELNLEYFGNHSGSKFVSPLVLKLLSDDGTLSLATRTTLADLIKNKFKHNWERLWLTNDVDYNLDNNYDITEKIDREIDDTGTDAMTYGKIRTTTHNMGTINRDYIAGFNSSTDPPPLSGRSDYTESGTTPVADTGSDTETKNLKKVEDSTIHRYGKIGATTTQYMIKEERGLWLWNYFDQVYRDVDSVLAIAYHDPCAV